MYSAKSLLPVAAAVAALAASVYIASHRKTPVEQAKEAVTARSSPSSPVPIVRDRNANRAKTSRDHLSDRMRRHLDLQERGYLAAKLGMAAVLGELKTDGDRESFLSGAFRRAAALPVPEALDWARQLTAGASRDVALLTLFCEWSGGSVTSVLQGGGGFDGGIAFLLGRHLLATGAASPVVVIAFATDFIEPSSARMRLTAEAAGKLAATDLTKALAIGDEFPEGMRDYFLRELVASWALYDSQGAWKWTEELLDSGSLSSYQSIIVSSLASKDVGRASRLLQSMPPNAERARMLPGLISSWAGKDTRSALQWAESLSDETERSSALENIRSAVPVGVGVSITGDQIVKIIPGSPASRAGLVEGDKIMAFTTEDGRWVETSNLDPASLFSAIRGAANTSLSLQVSAKGGGALRNVTLIREQLMMLGE